MAFRAVIINVNGRESTYNIHDAETLGAGDWDPGGAGANIDYFPAIYTEDFKPDGQTGFFLGHWPDGAGGQYSAIKVNQGFIGNWVITYQELYNLASGTPSAAPADGIVISALDGQASIIAYENTEKRVEYGYLAAGVYGLKGYADDGITMVFEMSDDAISLAGWAFSDTTLSAANISFLSGANPLITVGVNADWKIKIGGTAGSEYIGSSTFVSGPLGVGWKIDSTTARAVFQDIYARGKISTTVFEKDYISSVGGYLMVSNSDVLAVDMTAADASTLTIDGDTTFALNEILRIKDGVDDEWLQVTNVGAAPQYTVTRDLAGNYGANANPIWKKGSAVVSTGVASGGYIFMDASSVNSPYIDIMLRNTAAYDDVTIKARLGDLTDIADVDFGVAPSGFGLFSENVFLKGTIVTTAGAGKRITINEFEGAAFNNAIIFYGGDPVAEVVRIDDNAIIGYPGMKIDNGVIYMTSDVAGPYTWSLTARRTGVVLGSPKIAAEGQDNAFSSFMYAYTAEVDDLAAIIGDCGHQPGFAPAGAALRIGVKGFGHNADAAAANVITVGLYGTATNAGAGATYAGYFDDGDVYIKENLGIRTAAPGAPLQIGDGTHANAWLTIDRDSSPFILFNEGGVAKSRIYGVGDQIQFRTSIGGGPYFVVDITDGKTGIGTAAPDVRLGQKLDIANSGDFGGMSLSTWSVDNPDAAILDFKKSGSNTIGTHVAVADDEALGLITFRGSDGVEFLSAAAIIAAVDGAVTGGGADDMPGRLTFWTTPDGSSTLVERMRIDSAGRIGFGTAVIPHGGVGYALLALEGPNASAVGPHIQFTTATDDYPLVQMMNWSHDNIQWMWDAYYDGAYKSSDAGSNLNIQKNSDLLRFKYDSGVAQGGAITWNDGLVMDLTTGNVDLPTGRIASHHLTWADEGPTDNIDASDINTLFIDTGDNNVTIGGFIGGVAGQELRVVIVDPTNNTILEHAEGHAFQQIFLHKGLDETIDGHYGGWNLVCDGTHWYDESHAKHV